MNRSPSALGVALAVGMCLLLVASGLVEQQPRPGAAPDNAGLHVDTVTVAGSYATDFGNAASGGTLPISASSGDAVWVFVSENAASNNVASVTDSNGNSLTEAAWLARKRRDHDSDDLSLHNRQRDGEHLERHRDEHRQHGDECRGPDSHGRQHELERRGLRLGPVEREHGLDHQYRRQRDLALRLRPVLPILRRVGERRDDELVGRQRCEHRGLDRGIREQSGGRRLRAELLELGVQHRLGRWLDGS